MYGGWTEIAVLLRNFIGFTGDVFKVHIVQQERKSNLLNPHRFSILEGWFWESVFLKLLNDDDFKKLIFKPLVKLFAF